MEIIDRGDEWLEFVIFRVLDVRRILASDDTLEVLDDRLDGEKYRPNPENIDHENDRKPDEIDIEESAQDIRDESTFWGVISECP